MVTGLLGDDVLSYAVRLFALRLSGGILAGVFNSLATGMSPDNAVLGTDCDGTDLCVIGHAINIFMNVLGAMVHPMRFDICGILLQDSGYEAVVKSINLLRNKETKI